MKIRSMEVVTLGPHGARHQTDRFKWNIAKEFVYKTMNHSNFQNFLIDTEKKDFLRLLRKQKSTRIFKVTTTKGVWYL